MKKIFIVLFFTLTALSCGTHPTASKTSNTELTVHYNGKEVHRRGSKYISQTQLRQILENNKEVVLVFSAEWCDACKTTRKALKQADLKTSVHYLNIDELWVGKLAKIMGIKGIPFMLHADTKGGVKAARLGPGPIVIYLITRF